MQGHQGNSPAYDSGSNGGNTGIIIEKFSIEKFSTLAASWPEFLAYHWTNAGEWELGSAAWEKAGDFAASRRAFTEAERAYQTAIAALMNVPSSHELDNKELRLRSSLADALRITRGFSAQETVEATLQARALADRNGDRAQQFLQMWGAWTAASSSGNHAAAVTLTNSIALRWRMEIRTVSLTLIWSK